MVLPRPTPPQKYNPRCGARAGAGSQGRCARNLSPMDGDDSKRPALSRSSRTAASSWAASNSSRWEANSTLRRDSTGFDSLATTDAVVLKALVVRTGTALRRHPGDLARIGIFYVAGFAMHAIGGIDLQFLAAVAVLDHFVDIRRAKVGAWIAEFLYATRRAQA